MIACPMCGNFLPSGDYCISEECPLDPAIAPPVAAGSVDTAEFREVLNATVMCKSSMQIQCNARLLDHIDAWGAQQREAVTYKLSTAQHQVFRLEGELRESEHFKDQYLQRAEKAEADLESWVHTNRIDELQRELVKAEARVKELERSNLELNRVYEERGRQISRLEREPAAKQAIIDRLMLEYCPDEMTVEQMAEWASHQKRAE